MNKFFSLHNDSRARVKDYVLSFAQFTFSRIPMVSILSPNAKIITDVRVLGLVSQLLQLYVLDENSISVCLEILGSLHDGWIFSLRCEWNYRHKMSC